jgi:hypothetical protein
MKEADIIHETECGNYWVGIDREKRAYIVFEVKLTHSVSDSAYHLTPDGLSIAIHRANYLSRIRGKGLPT